MKNTHPAILITNTGKLNLSTDGGILASRQIGDENMEKICQKSNDIIIFNLNRNHITEVGVSILIHRKWGNLVEICLFNNNIGNKGCKTLSKLASNSLKSVNLSKNNIDCAGVAHIFKSTWDNLQNIYLHVNKLSHKGVWFIVKSSWLNLKMIGITSGQITFEQAQNLMLTKSQLINTLWLLNNQISVRMKRVIERLLEQRFPNKRCDHF